MSLIWDIVRRVKKDFAEADVDVALAILEEVKAEDPTWSDRLARCAVYQAQGDLGQLRLAIAIGKRDWRDLIVGAEYKGKERVRDFNRRFGGENVKKRRKRRSST